MITKNFRIEELVHPAIVGKWGDSAISWVHCDAPKTLQKLRDHLGVPITINDYHAGGLYESSGVRLPTGGVGASLSSHRGGFGFDLKFKGLSIDAVYIHIIQNPDLYPHISRIENIEYTRSAHGSLGRDWLHIEICHERHGDIYTFRP